MSVNIVAPKPTAAPLATAQEPTRLLSTPSRKRLIVSVESLRKHGKTHFSLTAPGPIGVYNFDDGLEGVAEKFAADKQIDSYDYQMPFSVALPGTPAGDNIANLAKKQWEQFVLDFRAGVEKYKTLVIDTGSEAWETIRLARLGKLQSILPHQYVAVNAEFRELLRLPSRTDCNLILLHKVKKEYVNDKPTGNYERAGFGDIDFVVQLVLRAYKDPKAEGLDQFRMKIAASRHNPLLEGAELKGEEISFPRIAAMVTGTNMEDWK